jgi:hypothetical protein
MSMMNVKETLKRLHKRLPTLSLDELFELLDCYVEQIDFSRTISTWEPSKVWYSTDKTTGVNETAKATSITTNIDSGIYTIATNKSADGKIAYYNGGGSTQLVAEH